MKPTQALGLLLMLVPILYVNVVSVPKDEHGRTEPRAYIQALMLITAFLGGLILVIV